jgi:hypothetical protein
MAKKLSPDAAEIAETSADASDVAVLCTMSREDRLRALMKNLDAVCGPLPSRGRAAPRPDGSTQKPDKER